MAADARLEAAHGEAVHAGQSAVVDEAHEHFACFVERSGQLVELDGRKAAPIAHGPTSPATLLEDVVRVVQGFMARDPGELRLTPGELRLTMLALTPVAENEPAWSASASHAQFFRLASTRECVGSQAPRRSRQALRRSGRLSSALLNAQADCALAADAFSLSKLLPCTVLERRKASVHSSAAQAAPIPFSHFMPLAGASKESVVAET